MDKFIDFYKNEVTLSFEDHPFSKEPRHVLVICRYENQWLLTRHKERGLEFPGGKVEADETAEEGAIREIMEETGARVKALKYLGQYYIDGKRDQVIKNLYYAEVKELTSQLTYYETEGPVLITNLPANIKENDNYSFIMKDNVIMLGLKEIKYL